MTDRQGREKPIALKQKLGLLKCLEAIVCAGYLTGGLLMMLGWRVFAFALLAASVAVQFALVVWWWSVVQRARGSDQD